MRHAIALRRNALVSALSIALLSPLAVQAQSAASGTAQSTAPQAPANQQPAPNQQKAVNMKAVVVTGSMIPRVEIEGPAPVVTITGAQIKAEGFTNFAEFMKSLPQVGASPQTASSWGVTSVNAAQLNLRNLGSGFSLLLINGVRVVDYPQYSSVSWSNLANNFQNYNNIPLGMIDHVEVLATGASSIYGSDAVAGVVNVILKKHYEGDELQVTGGGATRGGRAYGDINFFGGRSGDNWHIVYNVEKSNRSALWGHDRPYTESPADAGYGAWNTNNRTFGYQYDQNGAIAIGMNGANGQYITPPAGSCAQFPNFRLSQSQSIGTSGHQVTGPVTSNGYYCSQPNLFRNWVLSPGSRSNNGYVAGEYDFGNGLQLYGSAGLWDTVGISNTQLPEFYPAVVPAFYDQTSGQLVTNYVRQLTSTEMGSSGNTHDRERNWNITGGLRGTLFDSRFNWDLSLNTQKYTVREDYTGLDERAMTNFFLGQQQGTTTVGGTSYPVYAMNWNTFWNPITPRQYSQFAVNGENTAVSWLDQAQLHVNGDLFNVPWTGQPVGWAAVLEAAHNGYLLSPDPRGATVDFMNPFGEYNTGGGTRTRFSLGTEFRVPVLSTVTWTISGRIDKYDDASIANLAKTWGTGIEWRPYDGLLIRGTYGTNFKAPDMQMIYETESVQPIGLYADPLQCIQSGDRVCQQYQHATNFTLSTGGSRNLLPQTGHSWTYGFVWQVPGVQGLSLSADYWHMGVDNAIRIIDLGTLLTDEAGCLTGKQVSGAPYVAHALGSPYCSLVTKDVTRDANGNILGAQTGPINEASLYVSGVDASLDYKVRTESYGDFRASINYTDNLAYKERVLATDPLLNTRYNQVASRVTWTAAWSKDDWNATLSGVRNGILRSPNYGGCEVLPNGIQPAVGDADCTIYKGHLAPWITWNLDVGYQINDKTRMHLTVSNIFDKVGSIPYYAGGFEFIPRYQGADYTGREVFLKFDYKLD